jgi:aldehyde:ferredoxin oxidoreductase
LKGYTGKILIVDLAKSNIMEEQVPDSIYERFLTGVGLGVWYLYRNIPKGADPLGADNILGLASGLLTGTGSLVTGRWVAVCKSPLTGGWGDSNCGGTFSPAIKQSGYDGIFFKGISEKPVYLFIDDSGARLENAEAIWGMDALEAEQHLQEKHQAGKKPAVAVIGIAAEKLSLIAGICNDRGRIAARSGCGAVMGSKKLKAVVLAGTSKIECANGEEMRLLSKDYAEKVKKVQFPGFISGKMLPVIDKILGKIQTATPLDGVTMSIPPLKKWGTIVNNSLGIVSGDVPIKNWVGSVIDYNKSHYKNLNPDLFIEREVKKYSCYSCVIGCGGICKIDDLTEGRFKETHKPEYETCAAFGPLLMNKDRKSLFLINELLNRAGMDSISAGNTIAYAIECYEKGLISKEDTDGLDLTWGNADAIVALVEKMITRDGFGDKLADGVKKAAAIIGRGSESYAMHAGGQEPAMHDPRLDPLLGVHYSVDPTPGRHMVGRAQHYQMMHLWEEVTWAPRITKYNKKEEYIPSDNEALKAVAQACMKQAVESTGVCMFAAISGVQHYPIFKWLNTATGWDKSPDDYLEIGRRIQTLRQMFNIREGMEPLNNKMSDRLSGKPPLTKGPLKEKTLPIESMMRNYWNKIGWDEQSGKPLDKTISDLGIDQL